MQTKIFKIVLLFLVVACNGTMFVYAQTDSTQKKSSDGFATCLKQSNLLTNRKGKTVWFSFEKMKTRATETVKPAFPPSCRCTGTILVFVVVDAEGNVVCARPKSGNPLLRVASMRAAQKWKFEPYLKNGKATAYAGLLSFSFESHGEASF